MRKLQDLDEDRVAMGHKNMTDEERAKKRLSRARKSHNSTDGMGAGK